MEEDEFVSKIPEDALEILYELGEEFDIDPLSSSDSENYFNSLLSNYQGEKDGLTLYFEEQIKKDFKYLKEMPDWLQESDWQFHNGKPMCFVGQMKRKVNQDGYMHTLMFYVFWDMDTGITETIIQSD